MDPSIFEMIEIISSLLGLSALSLKSVLDFWLEEVTLCLSVLKRLHHYSEMMARLGDILRLTLLTIPSSCTHHD